jgi:HlyD family secretion protein
VPEAGPEYDFLHQTKIKLQREGKNMKKKIVIPLAAVVVAAAVAGYIYKQKLNEEEMRNPKFYGGNGRLEATEINLAAKLAGRVENVLVQEGDMITKGQPLVQMQINTLNAQMKQAKAKKKAAETNAAASTANVRVRESELEAARATCQQKQASLEGAKKTFDRNSQLITSSSISQQEMDNTETAYLNAKAAYAAAKANIGQAEAAVNAAKAEEASRKADVDAAQADIERIQADLDDSLLVSTVDGRVQYRIAEPGEVLSAGGRVLNLVDLTDVYMTFFAPEYIAGKIEIGAEVYLVLDALPKTPIPAKVTYVASVAQFTPKTVETQQERQKYMFRVKAHVDPVLLKKYIEYVKTGVPGMAWVRIKPGVSWDESPLKDLVKK